VILAKEYSRITILIVHDVKSWQTEQKLVMDGRRTTMKIKREITPFGLLTSNHNIASMDHTTRTLADTATFATKV
jgi:hypothetical protein